MIDVRLYQVVEVLNQNSELKMLKCSLQLTGTAESGDNIGDRVTPFTLQVVICSIGNIHILALGQL